MYTKNIQVRMSGDNFIPSSRNFAKPNLRADMWRNQDGTAGTENQDNTSNGGFWDIQASDLLGSFTQLGQTVITTKGQVDSAKVNSPKPPKSSTGNTTGGTTDITNNSGGGKSHKTLYIVLSVVGVAAIAGGIVMYMRKKKK